MPYVRAVEQNRFFIKVLFAIIALMAASVLAMAWLVGQSRSNIRVDVRPGLAAPVTAREGEMPSENVYNFALVVFQQLNRWRVDGAKDYPEQIKRVSAFLTDRYRGQLEIDSKQRHAQGELAYRTRSLAPPPELTFQTDRVTKVNDNLWVVYLDLEMQETIRGNVIKDTIIRYPIRVVAYSVDTQFNPYGLLLDGYQDEPVRLDAEELAKLNIVRK